MKQYWDNNINLIISFFFNQMETALLDFSEYKDVYEPAEDSFILLDALETELPFLRFLDPFVCLEIGSGSGVIICSVALTLGIKMYFATDVNVKACLMTDELCKKKNVNVNIVNTTLINSLKEHMLNNVDLLLFNPPYVPTPENESKQSNISASWAGGKNGREVIDKFLVELPDLLSQDGVCYLVCIQENNPQDIMRSVNSRALRTKLILTRRAGTEKLFVLRFWKYSNSKIAKLTDNCKTENH